MNNFHKTILLVLLFINLTIIGNAQNTSYSDSLTIFISDFRINNNDSGKALKFSRKIISAQNNGIKFLWNDLRNGNKNEVYSQSFDSSGAAIDNNTLTSIKLNYFSDAKSDANNNYLVTWSENNHIYLRKFNSEDLPITDIIIVDGNEFEEITENPQIAIGKDNSFILAWIGKKHLYPDNRVWTQKFSSDCNKIGKLFIPFKTRHETPLPKNLDAFCLSDSNYVFIASFNDNVFCQIYNETWILPTDKYIASSCCRASGASWSNSNFIILFQTYNSELFVKQYDTDANVVRDSVKIAENVKYNNLTLTTNPDSVALISWYQDSSSYAQILNSDFQILQSDIQLSNYPVDSKPLGSDKFAFFLNDGTNKNIYLSIYRNEGEVITENNLINDDSGSSYQYYSTISYDDNLTVFSWVDLRNSNYMIYWRTFDLLTGLSKEHTISAADNNAYNSSFVRLGDNNYIILWAALSVYYKIIDKNGNTLYGPFPLNDYSNSFYGNTPEVSSNYLGKTISVWDDFDDRNIYYQIIDKDYSLIGNNVKVNEISGCHYADCEINSQGEFFICWEDNYLQFTELKPDIRLRNYFYDGTPMGGSFIVNDDNNEAVENRTPQMALNEKTDNFVVTWYDNRNGNFDIYAQLFDKSGAPVGNNFLINDDLSGADQLFPAVAMDSLDNFVIAWEDKRNGNSDVYAQIFLAGGIPWGKNFLVNQDTLRTQYEPAVDVDGNKIYFSWTTNHVGGTGYDIWTNAFEWDWTTRIENETNGLPSGFKLDVYPNPFNSTAKVKYFVPKQSDVAIKIFDILGREISTLVSGTQPRGKYETNLSVNNLASGIYFVVMTSAQKPIFTKKILYVK